jgi:hypothetical protein
LEQHARSPHENYADQTVVREWESTPEAVRRLVQPEEPEDPMPAVTTSGQAKL